MRSGLQARPSGGNWTESAIHSFASGSDGQYPAGGLIFDEAGNLYGTTVEGGSTGFGVVYELSPSGDAWTETIVHTFEGNEGTHPWDTLVADQEGNFYGTASGGGSSGGGTVFELSPPGIWTCSLLYSFPYMSSPHGGIAFDSGGNIYGTTLTGGPNQAGTVFKLTPSNGAWTETVLQNFSFDDGGGAYPFSGVTLDSSGNIYGTTSAGGSFFEICALGCGTVWEITP